MSDGFAISPALADAMTHLGAIADTDAPGGSARVPVSLGAYKPMTHPKVLLTGCATVTTLHD